jgi:Glycosyl hydrolase family 57
VTPLRLYAIFHLNLAFSSIEEEQRPLVVERCYRPLLDLARELDVPFGIEATGTTLEAAGAIDPGWLADLRALVASGRCELVGSGWAQLIGPLVPAEVNRANLRYGLEAYERLLGVRPRLALVNEQAYSAGILPHYREAGFEAIVMEWDNAARTHPDWDYELRYLPQRAVGADGETLPVLWNNSIAFQKLQRYAHGELELDEHLDYLASHVGGPARALSLYGNDVEIFDFRPGRFGTEPQLSGESEWRRLAALFAALAGDARFELVSPSGALELLGRPGAGTPLSLETADQPVPVKKQGKYNLTRWAVTGRDDLGANTSCWRVYEALRRRPDAPEWRDLCELWASDFRTHITERRWSAFRARLDALESRVCVSDRTPRPLAPAAPEVHAERSGRWLDLASPHASLRLNLRRGLTIESLAFPALGGDRLAGTLPHGFFDDIALGADYYTGHLVLESPGRPKVTDLSPAEPVLQQLADGSLAVAATVETALGPVRKRLVVRAGRPRVELELELDWTELPAGSLRLGHVTLDPRSFDAATLGYATHNGGETLERFRLDGRPAEHGAAATFLVSASHALGITGGVVELGDAERRLRVEVDKATAALVGLVTYQPVADSWFCRLALSARESDETSRPDAAGPGVRRFRLALEPA